jgi:hypothetical protein
MAADSTFNERIIEEFRANEGVVEGPLRAGRCCSSTTSGRRAAARA